MRVDEYTECDATALADLVRRGDVAAADVHQVAMEAINLVNPQVNAVADGPWDRPLEHATDGPFGGVPFALKDLGCHPKGVPIRSGTRLSGDGVVSSHESSLIRRFRDAGLAIAALTTTPELGFNANTEAVVYGSTRNPWDLTRSAGGSSGGAAALVAAGGVPVAHASDGGGSIRLPAACNGLVGLKPSRGRTSCGPDHQEVLEGLPAEFVVTRTMRDCAAALDAVAGSMPGDKFVIQGPGRPWSQELGVDPGRLRIAIAMTSWSELPVDPEVAAAVEVVGRELQALGHKVEAATPSFHWDAFIAATVPLFAAGNTEAIDALVRATGNEAGPDTLEATTLASYEYGRRLSVMELARARNIVNEIVRTVGEFFTGWDLLITPTMNVPPLPLGHQNADDASLDLEGWVRRVFDPCSFTPVFNWTGTPAVSLPLGWTSDGLPIGVQLVAPMCEEATLIRVGSQLEQAMPWGARRPTVHAASLALATARPEQR